MSEAPKKLMTRAGYWRIAEEHRQLLEEVRPKVVQGVADAAAEGDRSENAEYIYGKKRLREIDKRLRYLSGLIKDVQLVDPELIRSDRVEFGATVTIALEDGGEKTYMIIGVGEADAQAGSISWQSPLARAMLGKRVGDVVFVERPSGDMEVEIVALRYGPA